MYVRMYVCVSAGVGGGRREDVGIVWGDGMYV